MNIPLTPLRFLRYPEQQFPHKTAVVCGNKRFSYAEFGARVGQLGGVLHSLGVQTEDRVAFLSTNCHRLLEAYYGVLEAGGVLLPLNIRLSPQELAYVLNDAGVTTLFLESAFLPLVEAFRNSVPLIKNFILLDGPPQTSWLMPQNYDDLLSVATALRCDLMAVEENSLAELFYTSGTSANPKGVFPAYRGGPMWYADTLGLDKVYGRILQFQEQHGELWQPAPLLTQLAKEKRKLADFAQGQPVTA
jgi:fatty-acyl-CoA synthase